MMFLSPERAPRQVVYVFALVLFFSSLFGTSAYSQLFEDQDNIIDYKDLYVFMTQWKAGNAASDLDGNGIVDQQDLLIFIQLYRQTLTIPTPTPDGTPIPTDTPSPGDTPTPTETPEPGDTPVPTQTPGPGDTPVPTETPEPGDTPIPTNTPTPTNTQLPLDTPIPTTPPTVTPTIPAGFEDFANFDLVEVSQRHCSSPILMMTAPCCWSRDVSPP